MFNKLFKSSLGIRHFKRIVDDLYSLITSFDLNYEADENAKDAAIDATIEILQAHKTTATKSMAPQPSNTVGK